MSRRVVVNRDTVRASRNDFAVFHDNSPKGSASGRDTFAGKADGLTHEHLVLFRDFRFRFRYIFHCLFLLDLPCKDIDFQKNKAKEAFFPLVFSLRQRKDGTRKSLPFAVPQAQP